jgi:hypothetical protein
MINVKFQKLAPKGPGLRCVPGGAVKLQNNSGLKVVLQARELLSNPRLSRTPKDVEVLDLLKKALVGRGGSLDTKTTATGTQVVVGEVRVSAGKATKEKMVALGREGKLTTEVLKETKGIDPEVVEKAKGFGAGALEVTYTVDKEGNAEYVLRTNGSRACLEANQVNVAMALVGAAEIVEEMVKPAAKPEVVQQKETRAA